MVTEYVIRIERTSDGYVAQLCRLSKSTTDDTKSLWTTTSPLSKELLVEALFSLGFHQRDIFDAFAAADNTHIKVGSPEQIELEKFQRKLGHFDRT
jgi:Holliday junction resolvasome RuvABC DNA-binding subunit